MRLQIVSLLITWIFVLGTTSLATTIGEESSFSTVKAQEKSVRDEITTDDILQSTRNYPRFSTSEPEIGTDDDRQSTRNDPRFTTARAEISTGDILESTRTYIRKFGCRNLDVHPQRHRQLVGENATYLCFCESPTDIISLDKCPEWRNIDGVLHSHSREIVQNTCIVTLELVNIRFGPEKSLICADKNSHSRAYASLEVKLREYDGKCRFDEDCINPYQCKESKCSCSDSKPIYVDASTEKCHSVKKLLGPCLYTVQCKGKHSNSYCHRSRRNSTEEGICLCEEGYEIQNDGCVSTDSALKYVYRYSKRYQAVLISFLSLCIIFILLGLLRICMVRKQDTARRTGRVISNRPMDEVPLTPIKK